MKAHTVALRPALGAVVGAEVVAIAAFAALPPYRFGWWPASAITGGGGGFAAGDGAPPQRGPAGWPRGSRWVRGRADTPRAVAAAVDISHGGASAGCAPPAMRR